METKRHEDLERMVDTMLRDKDFLLAQELKHKVDELNELLAQSTRQEIQVDLKLHESGARGGRSQVHLDIKVFKEL